MSKNSLRKSRRYGDGKAYYDYLRRLQLASREGRLGRSIRANLNHTNRPNLSRDFVDYVLAKDGVAEARVSARLIELAVERLRIEPPII